MEYELVKSAHIFAVISWMIGFLYLPRLMVYHADAEPSGEHSETLKIMERRLMRGIMTPAMIATWIFGIWLATIMGVWPDIWLWIKLTIVFGFTVGHFWLAGQMKTFANDTNNKSARFYRLVNEVPAVALICIILLVVVKPF
jgi:putative membrane protein